MSIERIIGVKAGGDLPVAFPLLKALKLPGVVGLYGLTNPNDLSNVTGALVGAGEYIAKGFVSKRDSGVVQAPVAPTRTVSIAICHEILLPPGENRVLFSTLSRVGNDTRGYRLSVNGQGGMQVSIGIEGSETVFVPTLGGAVGGWTAYTMSIDLAAMTMYRANGIADVRNMPGQMNPSVVDFYLGGAHGSNSFVQGVDGTVGCMIISDKVWTREEHLSARQIIRDTMKGRGQAIT